MITILDPSGGIYWNETSWASSDAILRFDPGSRSWTQVAAMKEGRYSHALSVVSVQDIEEYCH